jgi:hypothetical protein
VFFLLSQFVRWLRSQQKKTIGSLVVFFTAPSGLGGPQKKGKLFCPPSASQGSKLLNQPLKRALAHPTFLALRGKGRGLPLARFFRGGAGSGEQKSKNKLFKSYPQVAENSIISYTAFVYLHFKFVVGS